MRALPVLTLLMPLACQKAELAKSIPAVRVQKLDRSAGVSSARYSASIEPETRVELAFKVGGYVASIATRKGPSGATRILQDGDSVKRGEVLTRLRTTDYDQKKSQAQAALAEALAAQEKATLDYGRASKLRVGEEITSASLDAARVAEETSRARVEGAQATLAQAKTALEDSVLRAPMDGTVTKRSIEVGTLVAPGTVAFSIVDTSNVKVIFGVPDTVVLRLRLGARQSVSSEAVRGKVFEGTLSRISPTADPRTRLFEIEVSLANPESELKPGMIASLPLEMQQRAQVSAPVLVPLSAIVRSPLHRERYAVYLADESPGGTAVKAREVTLGEFMGNQIPVLSGLQGEEQIVVTGASLLYDGEPVRVIP